MDASASSALAENTAPPPARASAVSGGGRGSGRGRGRERGRGSGRGRGRGRGRGADSGHASSNTAGVAPADAEGLAAVSATEASNGEAAPAQLVLPPKKESKRGKGKKKNNAETAGTTDAAAAATPAPPPVERTPLETLVDAVRSNDSALFHDTLAKFPALTVNDLTKQRDGVLVEACRYARLEMVQTLVNDKHADVNMQSMNDRGGRKQLRPIHAAVLALRLDILDVLLAAPGQPVDLTAMYDVATPAMIAVFYTVANGYTEAQQTKALAILKRIIEYAKQQGDTVLKQTLEAETSKGANRLVHVAVMLANYEAVEVLKNADADFSTPNGLGLTPLQLTENNAFHRRSFTLSRLPLRADKPHSKKHSRKKAATDEATVDNEPESAAQVEMKVNHSVKRLDREVENHAVLRTLLPLIDLFGVGPVLSRKGTDGIRSIHVKGLVLAQEGIPSVINKIAALPSDDPKKAVYIDGVMHCVTSLYGLSLKNDNQFGKLWRQAFVDPSVLWKQSETPSGEESMIKESTLQTILDTLLDHKSLSRRLKVWTMIITKSLGGFEHDAPVSSNDQDAINRLPLSVIGSDSVYVRIAEAIFRSGCKMMFSIFDRTDIDEDESYEEELEFHLLLALVELFFQLFVPFCRVLARDGTNVAARFKVIIAPIKRLSDLLETAMTNVNETFASPQRFSLVLHTLQVFEVVESALDRNEEKSITALFRTVKHFAKQEASKKRFVRETSKLVALLQSISELFPLPSVLLDRVVKMKDKVDLLLRSDAKILGLDLYAFARHEGVVGLEHKVDYLEVLSEEQRGSVNITISRASNANYVDFILQQILSTSSSKLKGELDVALVDEPGVGAGVVREFFQIIERTFFNPVAPSEVPTMAVPPPAHVSEIGSQWLQLARNSPRNHDSARNTKRGKAHTSSDVLRFFPLFERAQDGDGSLRITPRNLRTAASVVEKKQQEKPFHLMQKELVIDDDEVKTLKQLYLCAGRLVGLAIRDQQPLDAYFPVAFWKFLTFEPVSWEEYCGSNDVFKRSLQFVLDHDFDAEPLEMHFEFTADVQVIPSDGSTEATPTTVAMEVSLPGAKIDGAVTNQNKATYVELRAKQFFFGNEFEYYKKMRDGLGDTIRKFDLKLFLPSELQRIVRGDRQIDIDGLRKSVIYSRGVTASHEVVRNFWDVVGTFDQPMKEKLLTFWSGSALPPLFGFHSMHNRLDPHLTYWYLDLEPQNKSQLCPTANTCDRRLMLPQYPTKEALREKLLIALEHGAVGYDRM